MAKAMSVRGVRIRRLVLVASTIAAAGGIYWLTRGPSLEDQVRADIEKRLEEQRGGFGGLTGALLDMMGGTDAIIERMRLERITPLHYGASVGNEELIRNALAEGLDINATDSEGRTPLHHATTNKGGHGVIGMLIDAGADINAQEEDGRTALMMAVGQEDREVAEKLIAAGADLNVVDRMGRSALLLAAKKDDDLVMLLLKAGVDVKMGRVGDTTALLWSSIERSEEVSLALLAAGAETDGKTDDEWMAIHFAAPNGQDKFIRALIAAGLNVDVPGDDGTTALQLAASNGLRETVRVLLECGAALDARNADGWVAMHFAAESSEVMELLLAKGASANARAEDGWTPLHQAIDSESMEAAKVLLAHKADVNSKTKTGWTPLHAAVSARSLEGTRLLLAHKADVNARDAKGWSPLMLSVVCSDEVRAILVGAGAAEPSWTALHRAAIDSDSEALRKALKEGADVNLPDRAGRTALMLACVCGPSPKASACIAALLEAKADPNIQDADGDSPIYVACVRSDAKMLDQMLAAGGKASLKDAYGVALLHVVCRTCELPLIKRLLVAGADVNARTTDGDTPLHWLCDSDSEFSMDKDDIALFLVNKGADLRARNKAGQLALDLIGYCDGELKEHVSKARFAENESLLDALLASAGKTALPDMTTPLGVLHRAAASLATDDRKAFVACFAANDDEKAFLDEGFSSFRAMLTFRQAMLNAHGPDGWYVFHDGEGFSFQFPWLAVSRLDHDDVDIYGSVAQCSVGDGDIYSLIRNADGQWRIDASSLTKGHGNPKEHLKVQRQITAAIRQLISTAGKPGVTAAQLEKEAMRFFFEKKD